MTVQLGLMKPSNPIRFGAATIHTVKDACGQTMKTNERSQLFFLLMGLPQSFVTGPNPIPYQIYELTVRAKSRGALDSVQNTANMVIALDKGMSGDEVSQLAQTLNAPVDNRDQLVADYRKHTGGVSVSTDMIPDDSDKMCRIMRLLTHVAAQGKADQLIAALSETLKPAAGTIKTLPLALR